MARRDIKYARKSQIGGTGSTTLNNFQDNGLSGEVLYNSGAVLASSATGVDVTGTLTADGATITGSLLAAQSGAGANAFAAGNNAGLTTQGIGSVAVGDQAGEITQGDYSIAIGTQCGETSQGSYSFSIGYRAGFYGQAGNCIALGAFAGQTNQATLATAIGWRAGLNTQGSTATAVGGAAGEQTQSAGATAVGYVAGRYSQGTGAVAIGEQAGEGSATPGDEQGDYAIAVGYQTGETAQATESIAIGKGAGFSSQATLSVAIGSNAGQTSQGNNSFSLGALAGQTSQGSEALALGASAGNNTQGNKAIAIGSSSGVTTQGASAVAVGFHAGRVTQGLSSVAIGQDAADNNQGDYSIAIGLRAGEDNQGTFAIAIGVDAGEGSATPGDEQGDYAIAIGYQAGEIGQGANGIIISSKGSAVNDTTAGHIHLESSTASLVHDGSTWAFLGGTDISVPGTVDGRDIASDGTTQDSHIADATLHFTEGSIDHTAITNIGTNTHAQIDTHIADATLHFTEGSIDHGSIAGLADDDHTQYLLVDGTRALTDNLLFSDATGAVIDVTTNSSTLTIQGRDSLSATNTLGFFDPDGTVEFYYDGDKVFSTVNEAAGFDGVRIHGISGSERPTLVLTDSAGSDKAVLAAWSDGHTYFDNRVDPSTGGGDIVMRTANHTGATIYNHTLTLKAETANGANDERIIVKHGFADTVSTYEDGTSPGLSVFGTAPAIWLGDDDSMTNPYFFLRRATGGKVNMRAMNPTDDFDLTTRTGDDVGNDIQIRMHGETGSGTDDAYVSLYHNNIQVAYTVADGFVIGDQAGASGDQFLKIIADNDNAVEASNAYIQLEQDGAAVVAQIGTTGSANQFPDASSITIGSGSGIPANSLVIGNKFSSAGIGFVVGSTAELIITSTGVAFNGSTPVAVPTYTVTNDVTDRTYDANSTSVAELADVLGTLIADLQANGLLN